MFNHVIYFQNEQNLLKTELLDKQQTIKPRDKTKPKDCWTLSEWEEVRASSFSFPPLKTVSKQSLCTALQLASNPQGGRLQRRTLAATVLHLPAFLPAPQKHAGLMHTAGPWAVVKELSK